MKQLKRLVIFATLLLVSSPAFAASSRSSKVKDGWSEAYGGNSESAEFTYLAMDVLLSLSQGSLLAGIDKTKIEKVIKNSRVICSKNLVLNGSRKDGVNFPNTRPQAIYLDCEKWTASMTLDQKLLMSVHEYLPLLGKIDDHYVFSSELVRHYKVKKEARAAN